MKKTTLIIAALSGALLMTGCAKHTEYAMVYDATGADLSKLSKGTACQEWNAFSGWNGDASISAAAKNGNIKHVKQVAHTAGQYSRCTIAYGTNN